MGVSSARSEPLTEGVFTDVGVRQIRSERWLIGVLLPVPSDSWLQRPESWLQRPESWLQRPESWLQRPDSWLGDGEAPTPTSAPPDGRRRELKPLIDGEKASLLSTSGGRDGAPLVTLVVGEDAALVSTSSAGDWQLSESVTNTRRGAASGDGERSLLLVLVLVLVRGGGGDGGAGGRTRSPLRETDSRGIGRSARAVVLEPSTGNLDAPLVGDSETWAFCSEDSLILSSLDE